LNIGAEPGPFVGLVQTLVLLVTGCKIIVTSCSITVHTLVDKVDDPGDMLAIDQDYSKWSDEPCGVEPRRGEIGHLPPFSEKKNNVHACESLEFGYIGRV
jgi:hypothetical protein